MLHIISCTQNIISICNLLKHYLTVFVTANFSYFKYAQARAHAHTLRPTYILDEMIANLTKLNRKKLTFGIFENFLSVVEITRKMS